MEIEIDVTKSAGENLSLFYQKIKKLKEKIERLRERIATYKPETVRFERKKKREWYEKFRWMFTSSGKLVIGGRDAKTNMEVVKKHLRPEWWYLHADVHGAPHCVILGEASEEDLKEAAVFAAVYSSAWKDGFSRTKVFAVKGSQVSLSPPSGQYLPKGAGMVLGERRWFDVELKIWIGKKGDLLCVSVTGKGLNPRVLLAPGGKRRETLKKLSRILRTDPNEIGKLLPPGDCEILEVEKD